MDIYASEEETVAAVKKWLKENGMSIITGVLMGLAVVGGWRTWLGYQTSVRTEAAVAYGETINALRQNNPAAAISTGGKIVSEHAETPYAAYASMAMAKADLAQDNANAAAAHYQWAMENAQPEIVRHLARQRLIRVLLSKGSLDEAGRLLVEVEQPGQAGGDGPFAAGYRELQGDLSKARGDKAGAAEAYQEALARMPEELPYRRLLELKYQAVQQQVDKEQG